MPHHKLGEQVCAWIKLKDGHEAAAQDIKLFCKDKVIGVFFVCWTFGMGQLQFISCLP